MKQERCPNCGSPVTVNGQWVSDHRGYPTVFVPFSRECSARCWEQDMTKYLNAVREP